MYWPSGRYLASVATLGQCGYPQVNTGAIPLQLVNNIYMNMRHMSVTLNPIEVA